MALVQMGHDDTLTFGYGPVHTNELAVLAHRVDLVQRQLILRNAVASAARRLDLYMDKRTG